MVPVHQDGSHPELPKQMVLGLNEKGVHLIDREKRR